MALIPWDWHPVSPLNSHLKLAQALVIVLVQTQLRALLDLPVVLLDITRRRRRRLPSMLAVVVLLVLLLLSILYRPCHHRPTHSRPWSFHIQRSAIESLCRTFIPIIIPSIHLLPPRLAFRTNIILMLLFYLHTRQQRPRLHRHYLPHASTHKSPLI